MGGKLKWILAAVLGLAAVAVAFALPKGSEEEEEDEDMAPEEEEEEDAAPMGSGQGGEYRGYVPEGCQACGGPYPLCRDGCNAFDD